jgi:uncharacterized membrane protein YhfC
MVMHVGLSLIVLQAFREGGRAWLLLAIGIHSAIDAGEVLLNRHLIALHTDLIIAVVAAAVLFLGMRLSGLAAHRPTPALAS